VSNLAGMDGTGNIWIGFNDITTETVFVWTDGSPVTYTNWNIGEPNNASGENCTEMINNPAGVTSYRRWNDLPCSSGGSVRRRTCEYEWPAQ
jgi:C-type mannose receptor